MSKAQKKRSILEEIMKMGHSSGGAGRPIIVVPASEYPGNLALKNAVNFMSGGKYVEHREAARNTNPDEKYDSKKTFSRKIGND